MSIGWLATLERVKNFERNAAMEDLMEEAQFVLARFLQSVRDLKQGLGVCVVYPSPWLSSHLGSSLLTWPTAQQPPPMSSPIAPQFHDDYFTKPDLYFFLNHLLNDPSCGDVYLLVRIILPHSPCDHLGFSDLVRERYYTGNVIYFLLCLVEIVYWESPWHASKVKVQWSLLIKPSEASPFYFPGSYVEQWSFLLPPPPTPQSLKGFVSTISVITHFSIYSGGAPFRCLNDRKDAASDDPGDILYTTPLVSE